MEVQVNPPTRGQATNDRVVRSAHAAVLKGSSACWALSPPLLGQYLKTDHINVSSMALAHSCNDAFGLCRNVGGFLQGVGLCRDHFGTA